MKKEIQSRNVARRKRKSRQKIGTEQELKKQRESYSSKRGKKLESQRQYDQSHREEKRESQIRYDQKHREEKKEYDKNHKEEKKEYYQCNREVLSKASRDRAQAKKNDSMANLKQYNKETIFGPEFVCVSCHKG